MQNLQNFRKDLAIFFKKIFCTADLPKICFCTADLVKICSTNDFSIFCVTREKNRRCPDYANLVWTFRLKSETVGTRWPFERKFEFFFSKQNISKIKFNGELIKGDSRVDFGRLSSRSMQSSPNKFGPLAKQKDSIWPNGRQSRKSTGLVRNQLAEKNKLADVYGLIEAKALATTRWLFWAIHLTL